MKDETKEKLGCLAIPIAYFTIGIIVAIFSAAAGLIDTSHMDIFPIIFMLIIFVWPLWVYWALFG